MTIKCVRPGKNYYLISYLSQNVKISLEVGGALKLNFWWNCHFFNSLAFKPCVAEEKKLQILILSLHPVARYIKIGLKTKTTTFTSNRWFLRDRKWNKFRNFWALFLLKLNFKLKHFQVVVWEKTNIVSNQCHLRFFEILSWLVCHKNDLNGRKNETLL